MQFIVTEEEIARLNETIGSLAIEKFIWTSYGTNQGGYRLVIEEIFRVWKSGLEENEDE
jgi:hypothetical protein